MVELHPVRVHRSEENLPRTGQLAWKIAQVAADPVEVTPEVTDMVINRIIDNASVAIASLNGPATAAGSAPPPPSRLGAAPSPSAASRASMSTAIAAEPSTAPTWRVAL